MSPLTCPEVEARLELYAADECDPAEAEAVRRHLADCPRCATAFAEARQLVGLIELRLQEPERLRRLQARIAAEAAPRNVLRFSPALRRVAALAAMLLLTVGLVGWLTPSPAPVERDVGVVVALREERGRGGPEVQMAPAADFPAAAKESRSLSPFQVSLELRNTTDRPMRVWVAGPRTELRLDLRGPGGESVPTKEAAEPDPRTVDLPPGESRIVPITRLTKPGDYTATAELTTVAWSPGRGERRFTARSTPMPIHVGGK